MKDLSRKIKKFIQRGRRGWSDEDTWDFDSYLSEVISGGCKHLANNTHSYPNDAGEAEWGNILIKISEGIIAPSLIDEEFFGKLSGDYGKMIKLAYKKQKKALVLLVTWFNHLWD